MIRVAPLALMAVTAFANVVNAQSTNSNTLYRAAYCVGVLLAEQDTLADGSASLIASCNKNWNDDGWLSPGDCRKGEPARLESMRLDAHRRWLRYDNYVNFAGPRVGTTEQRNLMQVEGKGFFDMRTTAVGARVALQSCSESCRERIARRDDWTTCLISCLEPIDQVRANVIRCEMAPDGLPF